MHISILKRHWHEFYLLDKPVVVLGGMSDWLALTQWTPDYFARILSGMEYPLRVTDDEVKYAFMDHNKELVSVGDFIANLETAGADGSARPFFGNIPMANEATQPWFEPVYGHFRFPDVLEDRVGDETRFWIGASGQKSSIHNDSNHGFNAQVYGRKRFILFPPDEYRNLYTSRITDETWASVVDWDDPDLTQYPLFAFVDGLEVVLQPGEMLYIPAFWWHAAKAISISINVNIWIFTADIGKWFQDS
jgi:lysine-specific demethylase 8